MADEERGQVRGLAVFARTQGCTCCVRPGLNTAIRVEFMARHVPSQAGNATHDLFVTRLYPCHLCLSIAVVWAQAPRCKKIVDTLL